MSDNLLGDFGDLLYNGVSGAGDLLSSFLPSQVNLGDTSGYFANELPSWMFEAAQPQQVGGFGMDSLGELINARAASMGGEAEPPWYTQANNFLKGNKDLIGFGIGGAGALAGYLDAKKRNKLAADALKKQLARQAALDSERKTLGTPMDYALARSRVTAPTGGRTETSYFTNNALSANPGVLRAAAGAYVEGGTPGQDDSVPALLSDGEFVLSADVVSALGDGNNAAGAKRLEEMMRKVRAERNKGGTELPPKAKAPLAYMKKGKK